MILLVPLILEATTLVGTAITIKNVYDTGKNTIEAIDTIYTAKDKLSKAKDELDKATEDYKRIMGALISIQENVRNDLTGLDRNWRNDSLVGEIQQHVKQEMQKVLDEFNVAQEHKPVIVNVFEVATTGGIGTVAASITPKVVKFTLEEIAIQIGTSSTGKAISALTGASQRNAIYAWLGGGAKSSGGLGIAGGKNLASRLSKASVFSIVTTATSIISNQILCKAKENANKLDIETNCLVIKTKLVKDEYAGKAVAYEHLKQYVAKANLLRFSEPKRAKTILIGVLHHLDFMISFEHFYKYGEKFMERINQKIKETMRGLSK